MTMCVAIKNLDLKSKSKANLPQVIKKREREIRQPSHQWQRNKWKDKKHDLISGLMKNIKHSCYKK